MHKMKKQLIDITFNLLYQKGYCATNLNDIVKEAHITKGSLYYHFESKHDLVLSSIKYYLEYILNDHWIEPLKNTSTPKETLIQQIELYQKMFIDKNNFLKLQHGCPLSNFILDMSDKDSDFFNYLKDVYIRWQNSIERTLIQATELKELKKDINPNQQSLFIISSLEGCIGSAKAYNDLKVLEDGFQILIEYVTNL